MANICDNKFYLTSDKNFTKWSKVLCDALEERFNCEITWYDESDESGFIEGYFDSKWTFPIEVISELFVNSPEEDNIYFRCLSEEYGLGYIAMNVYKNNEWFEEHFTIL